MTDNQETATPKGSPMTKSELLNGLQEKHRQWEALLDQIDPTHMEQPGVNGDWSMKDLVAHLTTWNRWTATRLQAARRGEPEPLPRSVREVLDETHQVNQQIFAVMENLPDEVRIERIEPAYYIVWLRGTYFLPGEFFDHFHDDHEPDVRAWLARKEKK